MGTLHRALLLVVLATGCGDLGDSEPRAASDEPAPVRALPPDGLFRAELGEEPSDEALEVTAGPRRGSFATLRGEALELVDARVVSQHDDNSRYYFAAYLGQRSCGVVVAVLAGAVVSSSGGGSESSDRCLVDFTLDRAQATAAARVAGVERADRAEIGADLEAALAPARQIIGRGQPAVVHLELSNPLGAEPIQYQVSTPPFEVGVTTRDGEPIAPRAPAMSAISAWAGFERLERGESATVSSFDVSERLDLSEPGIYRTVLTTRLLLAPADVDPADLGRQHRRWTRVVRAPVVLDVR